MSKTAIDGVCLIVCMAFGFDWLRKDRYFFAGIMFGSAALAFARLLTR